MMDLDRRCRPIGMGHGESGWMDRLKTVKCKLRSLSKRRNSGMFANHWFLPRVPPCSILYYYTLPPCLLHCSSFIQLGECP